MATEYVVMSNIRSLLPGKFIRQALDDDRDGVEDADVWAEVQAEVRNDIDARLGQRVDTPFKNPLPAIVAKAARVFAAELLYKRRGVAGKACPVFTDAEEMRAKLDAIGAGNEPLPKDMTAGFASGAVIAETAKTVSSSGKTLS